VPFIPMAEARGFSAQFGKMNGKPWLFPIYFLTLLAF